MINAIRAKRERLRQSRAAAPDYISLDGGSNHGEAEGLSDEEPELQRRIALIGDKVDSKKGVFEDTSVNLVHNGIGNKEVEVSGDEAFDEEDEVDKLWEEEQFRKGFGKRMDDGVNRVAVSTSSVVPLVQTDVQPTAVYPSVAPVSYPSIPSGPSIGGSVGWYAGLSVMSLSQQASLSQKAIHENVARLKLSPGDSVMDVRQFLLDTPETCFFTCYDLLLHTNDGSVNHLEGCHEISEVADITTGVCSLEMIADRERDAARAENAMTFIWK